MNCVKSCVLTSIFSLPPFQNSYQITLIDLSKCASISDTNFKWSNIVIGQILCTDIQKKVTIPYLQIVQGFPFLSRFHIINCCPIFMFDHSNCSQYTNAHFEGSHGPISIKLYTGNQKKKTTYKLFIFCTMTSIFNLSLCPQLLSYSYNLPFKMCVYPRRKF